MSLRRAESWIRRAPDGPFGAQKHDRTGLAAGPCRIVVVTAGNHLRVRLGTG